jgi:tyrosyl-tRNA synthetase
MYGKLMSLPDQTMRTYFEALTDIDDAELDEFEHKMAEGTLNPRDVKRRMAREIVTEFHDTSAAQEAEEAFIRQFSQRQLPTDILDYPMSGPKNIVEVLVDAKMAESNNKARELIKQGAVSWFPKGESSEPERITDFNFVLPAVDGGVLKAGKRRYIRIKA